MQHEIEVQHEIKVEHEINGWIGGTVLQELSETVLVDKKMSQKSKFLLFVYVSTFSDNCEQWVLIERL